MNKHELQNKLEKKFTIFGHTLSTSHGEWIVKGFIDIYKNIYIISVDTKVISKLIELILIPVISKFASDNNLKLLLTKHQNHYPDVSLINHEGKMETGF